MSEVLTKQTCAASATYDMVGVQFGPHRVLMYYQTAFRVAAGTLQSAKLAARFEGVNPRKWVEEIKVAQQDPLEPLSREYRRSRYRANFETWKVGFDGSMVVYTFDDTVIKIHYSEAVKFYSMIRLAGKNAKRWAGDRGKQWSTRAHLADAEENDKFLYVT